MVYIYMLKATYMRQYIEHKVFTFYNSLYASG